MADQQIPIVDDLEEILEVESEIPEVLAILPIESMVVYPFMIAPVIVTDEKSKKLIEDALRGDRILGIFT